MSVTPNLSLFLDRLASRSELTGEERQAILALPTRVNRVAANRDVFRLDDRKSTTCVVIEGLVARFDQSADGERQVTALHLAGDAVDLLSVFLPASSFGASALCACTVAHISHDALRTLVAHYPKVAVAFLRDATVDASILAKWLVNVGHRDAKTRIAHLLCELAARYKAVRSSGEITFNLPLTQAHLADATGLTAVHVNRTLKQLSLEGLATVHERVVRIPDWSRITHAGMFTPDYLHVPSSGFLSDQGRQGLAAAA